MLQKKNLTGLGMRLSMNNQMKRYTTIIWDWNGTLLNDIEASLLSINKILGDRKMPLLNRESYREVFGFPVKSYYEKVGFDFTKDDWEVLANDYINNFFGQMPYTNLFDDVIPTLDFCTNKGINHFILSAMEYNQLLKDIDRQGINEYFEAVYGINNIYAGSKVELGNKLLNENNIDKDSTLMIGDTIHDYEVASSMGIDCILCSNGHQAISRLEKTNCKRVITNLAELKELF